jgi:hypothetical protein
MQNTQTTRPSLRKAIESWELPDNGEKLYSADAVIDAYLRGKREQLEQAKKVIMDKFESNLVKAASNTEKLFSLLREAGIKPFAAYLRARSFDIFEVLITLGEEDFLGDQIEKVYSYASEIEQQSGDELFKITYRFTYTSESFNYRLLKSDGYIFKARLSEG